MGYRPTYNKKCKLVLLDEANRPINGTLKIMLGGEDKANAYAHCYIEDYNNKRSETEPKAEKWQVIV